MSVEQWESGCLRPIRKVYTVISYKTLGFRDFLYPIMGIPTNQWLQWNGWHVFFLLLIQVLYLQCSGFYELLNRKNMLLQIFEDRWTMFYLYIPYLLPYIHSTHPPAAVAMRGGDSEGWRDFVFAIWMVASGAYSWFDVGAPWIKMEGMFLFKEISGIYWGSSKEVSCLSSATRLPSFWESWMFEDESLLVTCSEICSNLHCLLYPLCWEISKGLTQSDYVTLYTVLVYGIGIAI